MDRGFAPCAGSRGANPSGLVPSVGDGEEHRIRLPIVRARGAALGRAVRRLRRVEHARRGAEGAGEACAADGRRAKGAAAKPVALRDVSAPATERHLTGIAELDRVLGGGLVAGLAGPPRRLAGHRQVDADGDGAGQHGGAGRTHALRLRRGVGRAGPDARAAARARVRSSVPAVTETSLENVLATLRPSGRTRA